MFPSPLTRLLLCGAALTLGVDAPLPTNAPRSSPPPSRTLRVEVVGCAAVLASGACERPRDGRVSVFVGDVTPGRVAWSFAGAPLSPSAGELVVGGHRFEIPLPAGAGRVEVVTTGEETPAGGSFEVVLPAESPAWLSRAQAHKESREPEQARALLAPHEHDPVAELRARALGLLGRIELAEGHADAAAKLLAVSSALAREAGRVSDAVADGCALAFTLAERKGAYQEALDILSQLEPLTAKDAQGAARLPYYRGLVLSELGDARHATIQLRRATEEAARLGLTRLAWNATTSRALQLQRLGRFADAETLLRELESGPADVTACERADVAHNRAFGAALESERASAFVCVEETALPSARASAVPGFTRAHDLFVRTCPDPYRVAMAEVMLAETTLAEGDRAQAKAWLASARRAMPNARAELRVRSLDVEARLALADGDPARTRDAIALSGTLLALAEATSRPADQARALHTRAEARWRQGDRQGAVEDDGAAEQALDLASALVPLGGEREGFLALHEASARARVDHLLALGRTGEALDSARRARRRGLTARIGAERLEGLRGEDKARWERVRARYRDERRALDVASAHDWELAARDLARARRSRARYRDSLRADLDEAISLLGIGASAPAPLDRSLAAGEVLVALHPLRDAWAVFVVSSRGARVTARRVRASDPSTLTSALLAPALPELEGATNVVLLVPGSLACLDFHRVPLSDGVPLGLAKPVAYSLDLAPTEASSGDSMGQQARANETGRALVAGDTRGDLPAARQEVLAVAEALRAGAVTPSVLLGADAAKARLDDALGRAPWFHFAGHGSFTASEPWRSALPLPDGLELTVADVLALPRAPATVVLSACEAGRSDPSGVAAGLSLGHAFLLAGAENVVAPSRRVRDTQALAFARSLYASRDAGAPIAVRDAAAALARDDAASDWAVYRLWRR